MASNSVALINERTSRPKHLKLFNKHKCKEVLKKMKERLWKWQVIQGSICYKVLASPSIYKVLLLRSQKYQIGNASSSKTDVCAFCSNCQCDKLKNSKFRNFVLKNFSFLNFENVKMYCLKKTKNVCKSSKPTLSQKNPSKRRSRCSINPYPKTSECSNSDECSSIYSICEEDECSETSLLDSTNTVTWHETDKATANQDTDGENDALINSELSTNLMSEKKICLPEEVTCPGTPLVVNNGLTNVVAFFDTDMKLVAPMERKVFNDWKSAEGTCSILQVSCPETSTKVDDGLTNSLMLHDPRKWALPIKHFADWNSIEENCSSHWYSFISQGNINEKTLQLTRVLTSSTSQQKSSAIKVNAYTDPENVWESLTDSCTSTWHTFIGQKDSVSKKIYSFIDSEKPFPNHNSKREHFISFGRNGSTNQKPVKIRTLKHLEMVSPEFVKKDVLVRDWSNDHSSIDKSPKSSKPSKNCAEYDLNVAVDRFNPIQVSDPHRVQPNGLYEISACGGLKHGLHESSISFNDNCSSSPTTSFTQEDMHVDEADLITDIVLYSAEGNCTSHITSETMLKKSIEEITSHSSNIDQYPFRIAPELSGQSFGSVTTQVSKCPVSLLENDVLHTSFEKTAAKENHAQAYKVMDVAKIKDNTAKVLSSNHVSSSYCYTNADDGNEIFHFSENKLPSPFPSCKAVFDFSCLDVQTQPESKNSEGGNPQIGQQIVHNKICELSESKLTDSKLQHEAKRDTSEAVMKEMRMKIMIGQRTAQELDRNAICKLTENEPTDSKLQHNSTFKALKKEFIMKIKHVQNASNMAETKLLTASKPKVTNFESSASSQSKSSDSHAIRKTQNGSSEIMRIKEFKNAAVEANTEKKSKNSINNSAHIENKIGKFVPSRLSDERLDPVNTNAKISKSVVEKVCNSHLESSIIEDKKAKLTAFELCDPRLDSDGELKYSTDVPRPLQLKRVKWGFKRKRPKEKSASLHTATVEIPICTSHQTREATKKLNQTYLNDPRLKRRFSADTVHDLKNQLNFIAEKKDAFIPTIDLRVLNYTAPPLRKRHSVESSVIEDCGSASREMTDSSSKPKHIFQPNNIHFEPQRKPKFLNRSATIFENGLCPQVDKKPNHRHIKHCPEDEVSMLCNADSKSNHEKTMFSIPKNKVQPPFVEYKPQNYTKSYGKRKFPMCKCTRKIHINIESHKQSERCWLHSKKRHGIDHLDKKRAHCDSLSRRVSHHEDLLMDNIVSSTTDTTEVSSKNVKYDDFRSSKLPSPDINESVSSKPSFSVPKITFAEQNSCSELDSKCCRQKGYSQQSRPRQTLSKLEEIMSKDDGNSVNIKRFGNSYFRGKNFRSRYVSETTDDSNSTTATISTIEKAKTKDPSSLVRLKKEFVSKYINRKANASETPSKVSKTPVLSMPSLAVIEGEVKNTPNPVKNADIGNKRVDAKNISSERSTKKRKTYTEALESNKPLLLRSKTAVKKPKIFNPAPSLPSNKLTENCEANVRNIEKPGVVNHSTKTSCGSDVSKHEKSKDINVKSNKSCKNKDLRNKLRNAIKSKIALNGVENKKLLNTAKNKKSLNVIHNADKMNKTKDFTSKNSKTVIKDLNRKTNTKVMVRKKSKNVVQKNNCNFGTTEKKQSGSAMSNSAKSNNIEVLTSKKHEETSRKTRNSSKQKVPESENSESAIQSSSVTSKKNNLSGDIDLLSAHVNEINKNSIHIESSAKSETLCSNASSVLGESTTEEGRNTVSENIIESEINQCIKNNDTLPSLDFPVHSNHSDSEINDESQENIQEENENDKLRNPDVTNKSISCLQNSPSSIANKSFAIVECINIEQNVIDISSDTTELKRIQVEVKESDVESCNVGAPEQNMEHQNLVQYSREKLPSGKISPHVHTSENNPPKESSGKNDAHLDNKNNDVENPPATESRLSSSLPENMDIAYWNLLSSELFNSLLDNSVYNAKESLSDEHHASKVTEYPPPEINDPSKSCVAVSEQNISTSYSSTNCGGFQAVLPKITPVISAKNDNSLITPNCAKSSFNYSVQRNEELAQVPVRIDAQKLPARTSKKLYKYSPSKSTEFHDFEPKLFICSIDHSDGSKCNLNKSFKTNCCYSDKPFPCNVTLPYSCIKVNSTNLFEKNGIFDLYYKHLKQSGTHVVDFDKMKTKDQLDSYSQEAFDFLYGQLCYHECLLRSYIHKASEPGTPTDMNLVKKISAELDVIQGYRLACKAILL